MIKTIFLKEIKNHITTKMMIFTYAIILILFIADSIIFTMSYKNDIKQYQKTTFENSELIRKKAFNLAELTFTEQHLLYPPSVLGFLSEAMEKNLPNGINTDFFSVSNPQYYKKINVFFSELQTLDWNNIIILFVSFICIFFSYNSFSGEKADGTLKLMFSNSVQRSYVLVGKYLSICFIVLIPIVTGIIISLAIFQMSLVIRLSAGHYLQIVLFLLSVILFVSLNVLIGMLISTLTSKPVISLSFIILIWLFFYIVLPSIGWIFAEKYVAVKSIKEINNNISYTNRALGGSMWNDQWKTPTDGVLTNKKLFDQKTDYANKTWNEYQNSLFIQTNSGIAITKISPFQVFRFLNEKISDNGYFRYCNLYNQVKEYQNSYRQFIINKDQTDIKSFHLIWVMQYQSMNFMSQEPVSYNEIPMFEYKSPSFSQTLNSVKFDFVILMAWNLVLYTAVIISLGKYDIR